MIILTAAISVILIGLLAIDKPYASVIRRRRNI